ncbi:hypothetical protein GLOIN_2v1875900 [Rhizophagus clarus]|uniref:RING-type domain-containing protein n=1 Tax=Rhizophagus clarus TaxID=94130 RepID=A0A8H3MHI3_9GLOM|nr:hypothetical protein GLOIN_2v1875900 [Rhizophagus clarus]
MQCVIASENQRGMFSPAKFTSDIKTRENLTFNILKNLEDATIRDMEIPSKLRLCLECDNKILMLPIKAFTVLSCGYMFHRLCIKKKLLHTSTSVCPFSDYGKNVKKIDDEVANRRDSQSITSSMVGRMEKQLQNNTTETILEEAPEELEQEMDVDGEEEKLIWELTSDTMPVSEIKEKRGLHREAIREVESDQTLFDLYLEISNAEE